jgi:hypothetical protein
VALPVHPAADQAQKNAGAPQIRLHGRTQAGIGMRMWVRDVGTVLECQGANVPMSVRVEGVGRVTQCCSAAVTS